MAELLLVLNCEEIPARMQENGAKDLNRLLSAALDSLRPREQKTFWGPRHIAVSMTVEPGVAASTKSERGPRENAPEQALDGFLRKHGATRESLTLENGFWVLNSSVPAISATDVIAEAAPELLWRFPWPKSMRWGSGSHFTWVRPLRHIVCLLDGTCVPFSLGREDDYAHGLRSGTQTEGHRFMAPGLFEVTSAAQWETSLLQRKVIADAAARAERILSGISDAAETKALSVVPDAGLVDEVAGLTEWPNALLGRIDDAFMDLPPEVMQVSMKLNQRYFALRDHAGKAAPWFAFVANMEFADQGALTIAGNERVLRARFSDARHFWDLDRRTPLAERVDTLKTVTFHARLGTQAARVGRIEFLAREIARAMALDATQQRDAARAAYLAKADLTTGMVGEFPELQGVMGGYYARHDKETNAVADAVAEHYMPRGLNDDIPRNPVSIAVALADRLDTLAGFFAIDETPTGSGDPYGLRRAALGVIRIVRDNGLRFDLGALFDLALTQIAKHATTVEDPVSCRDALMHFMAERLRVQLRNEGERHDVLSAVLARGLDGDLVRLLARTEALARMLSTDDGRNLLAASKRAANILRIENRKDGPHVGLPDPALYRQAEEQTLAEALKTASDEIHAALDDEHFTDAMRNAAGLRPALDRFFEGVTVNDADSALRRNRLKLLARIEATLSEIADFGQIDG
ncbi:glycine--tRNA ligase subunit beta [Brytella acorum]|uniref:Glycine--tRNA ligase beta subunit n=1 Tax=Brytella acorum TaxID=2959299 RepID=A0AA35XW06_9PROT|nr:glycine--tRNA ligase subunit beta [Brytella acorum]MDF3625455.1 glycine--tRNA ligase subunit beta [Brytella acorum]CAI9120306.1 glycine--tRNA ligase subunit beta [Brytella acorum]